MLPGMKARIFDKTVETTRARVEALGGDLVSESRCGHDETEIAAHLRAAREGRPDMYLVAGASANVDRRDVVPSGIEQAGGEIVPFGMPGDPGNLMRVGELAGVPAPGLPGCARSPTPTRSDLGMERPPAHL